MYVHLNFIKTKIIKLEVYVHHSSSLALYLQERVVHAKGAGAHGYFEVTDDITQSARV